MSALETMKSVIASHNLMHLASLDEKGLPCVRGLDYAAGDQDNILYFMTRKDTRKVPQISARKQVSVVIDHDCPRKEDLAQLAYLKAEATAAAITDPQEAQAAMGAIFKKFPFLAELPGDPSDFVPVRVELKKVAVTDNRIAFNHTETISF